MRGYFYDFRIGKVLILKINVKIKVYKEKSVNFYYVKIKSRFFKRIRIGINRRKYLKFV